ncbi:NADP-dependent aldehyde dehydrogenase [Cohaesibacter sp. ES.047]|uniref:aldehyde dehydrogenase (NADP(+)) n=1 Tax=Cohaesibacter sp. ES.047 TaxID=1798205 RepID=UPI000BB7EED9|nr:aldehyde dehydrogenase (NADP(+)) [Cohaesibacter sp. ES.047]SNY93215.1 NADP-dependent aldehyde dehydrogenase [Cohaesibacter sp. ES.047]
MAYKPHGKHLIAGEWIEGDKTFSSSPATGGAYDFFHGSPELVDTAVKAAEDAFWTYGYSSREDRGVFLETIAEEIESRGADITEMAMAETALPQARLEGERGRTTGQLKLFASHIRKGDYLDRRHDEALPERAPLPRPELFMMQRPIGPVAVFGASNFPLAFSVAGGDTASALAAGCPVVVKGHDAHPGTAELVADAFKAAIERCNMPKGVFSMVHGGSRVVGTSLVQHPLIKAAGFTGSLAGGRALYDLCASRPEPIPFFGELGSVNPMFILPQAVAARGEAMGKGWAGSLAMGAGQFCTNPGIAVVLEGPAYDAFVDAALAALSETGSQVMLTDGIADAYRSGAEKVQGQPGVQQLLTSMCDRREAKPFLFKVSAEDWLGNETLSEEVFGPLGLVVVAKDIEQMVELAKSFEGQLTATLHMDEGDMDDAGKLLPVLERKAGRVMANGFPTGVEVCDTMVHGGPYPASTNFGATSVGTLAIRRFLRPVCYQNIPAAILPSDLV